MTPERRRTLKTIAVNAGFGLFVFSVAFYFAFPYDRIKDMLVAHAAAEGYSVEIADIGPAWGVGMSLEDILVSTRPTDGSKAARMRVDTVQITVSPLPLIWGTQSVAFDADAFGGEIDVDFRRSKTAGALLVEAQEIAMSDLPGVVEAINLPLGGTLGLSVDLATPNNKAAEANGIVKWKCEGATLGDGKSQLKIQSNPLLREGLSLPKIRFGDFVGRVAFQKGVGKLQGVSAKSPDGELVIEGEIRLADPIQHTYADLYVRFKLSDALLKKSEKLSVMLDLMGSSGKRADGFLGFRMMGPISRLGRPMWMATSPFSGGVPAARPSGVIPGVRGGFPPAPAPPIAVPEAPIAPPPTEEAPALDPSANMPRYPTEGPMEEPSAETPESTP